jgi:hypothetical protein
MIDESDRELSNKKATKIKSESVNTIPAGSIIKIITTVR